MSVANLIFLEEHILDFSRACRTYLRTNDQSAWNAVMVSQRRMLRLFENVGLAPPKPHPHRRHMSSRRMSVYSKRVEQAG